jgi:cation diffusion facilitator family transporter
MVKSAANDKAFQSRMKIIRLVLILSVGIMALKFVAFWLTKSGAILSDALESLINIATSTFTLYSIYYAAKLRDEDHPYGHGKVEYFAIGFEGALIFGTGIYIIIHSYNKFLHPQPIQGVDAGILLTAISGLIMYFIGSFLKNKGRELHSEPLVADGTHFHTDAITSAGLIAGLLLFRFTGWLWVDPLLASLLALHIMSSGFQLLKEAIDRLMDKVDLKTIQLVTEVLENMRRPNWIDIHNLRVQKFGDYLHIDCHLTLPFYLNLEQVHDEIKTLEKELNNALHQTVELFIHTDPCQQIPCALCSAPDCKFRKTPLLKRVNWNSSNLMQNEKHQLPAG